MRIYCLAIEAEIINVKNGKTEEEKNFAICILVRTGFHFTNEANGLLEQLSKLLETN